MRGFLPLQCLLLGLCCVTVAQNPSSSPAKTHPSTATFRTNARVVLLDVVVTDKSGKPVHGLKSQDFSIVEDGKVQRLKGFEERGAQAPKKAASAQLPPNTYTNYVASEEPGAVNVILFDTLNTDRQTLSRGRKQLLEYLSTIPPNTKVALFTLGNELHLVHGFTEDTEELKEAAKHLSSTPNPIFRQAREVSEDKALAAEVGLTQNPKMYAAFVSYLWGEYEGRNESRTLVTMQALRQLAQTLAVVPGRKNLIWLSGGIPFDPASTDPQMRKTAGLLAATQITVYPIDLRGLPWLGADGVARSSEVFGVAGAEYAESSGQADEQDMVRQSMREIARLTGGRAYLNRNDLPEQMNEIVATGSDYYILAYRPDNDKWDGRFRKVTVKAAKGDLKVQSRPGYYAVPDPFGSPDVDRAFSLAMQPAVPPSTALIIKAQVLPPDVPSKPASVDVLVDLHDLTFVQSDDHHEMPDLMFVAAAWDPQGKPGGSVTGNFHQALDGQILQTLMHSGLRLHQELQLKPGTYQLRVGVVDRLSGKIGTLDVPLKVEEKVASVGSAQ